LDVGYDDFLLRLPESRQGRSQRNVKGLGFRKVTALIVDVFDAFIAFITGTDSFRGLTVRTTTPQK